MSSEASDGGPALPGEIPDLVRLYHLAVQLLGRADGIRPSQRRRFYASATFGHVCLMTDAVLRLHPESPLYSRAGHASWNLPALAAIARVLLESCANLHYFSVDNVDDEERDFRFLIASIHAEAERLHMFESARRGRRLEADDPPLPGAPTIEDIRCLLAELRARLDRNRFYQSLCQKCRARWAMGKHGFCLRRSERASRAGMAESVYDGEYKYLSSYTHTAPYAMTQTAAFDAHNPAVRDMLFGSLTRVCSGCLALAITHFLCVFPELRSGLTQGDGELVDVCSVYATGMHDAGTSQASPMSTKRGCPACGRERGDK